jgi:hypothetical protein
MSCPFGPAKVDQSQCAALRGKCPVKKPNISNPGLQTRDYHQRELQLNSLDDPGYGRIIVTTAFSQDL